MLVFYYFFTVEKNINIYSLSLSIGNKKTAFPTFDPRTAYAMVLKKVSKCFGRIIIICSFGLK